MYNWWVVFTSARKRTDFDPSANVFEEAQKEPWVLRGIYRKFGTAYMHAARFMPEGYFVGIQGYVDYAAIRNTLFKPPHAILLTFENAESENEAPF